jgi:hypothetical protein
VLIQHGQEFGSLLLKNLVHYQEEIHLNEGTTTILSLSLSKWTSTNRNNIMEWNGTNGIKQTLKILSG